MSRTTTRQDKRLSGRQGEDAALAYLERCGLRFLQRNYRCRLGEIDLIMQESNVLVFVEVRKRRPGTYGSAAESITRGKQQKLVRTALHFLQNVNRECPCRFDVVALDGDRVSWLKNVIETA
ncbi:MAG: YraN family protein [Burkholderiaceae bacterium]|jgi:putative endonuclease|nr:YraN family protein [Burkholderiaceae bacterium]